MVPPGGGPVSAPENFASKYGLAPGARSTQRQGETHYLIASYHQLHCLVSQPSRSVSPYLSPADGANISSP
ncbi:hypothetical protein F5X98DRAFT_323800 [Xylaria grammica]|nr:hypothetical protein F5X98DRAFT_323800 [Xylaria grammica]